MKTRFFKYIATLYSSQTGEFWKERGLIQSWTKKQAKEKFAKKPLEQHITLVKVIFIFEKIRKKNF